uniref:tRNA-uridine aminocarboxypropyltransferase 1 n=1 Tax=Strigamia maritima TaxID=126957 RepID=T1J642_STRMM
MQPQENPEKAPNPFANFHIDSTDLLDTVDGRSICDKCTKSRKYYCYTCHIPVITIRDKIPNLKLPIKIDIIKYPKEIDGKSTASHAAVLAPDDVTIYTFPNIPMFTDKNKVLVAFPGKRAVTLEEVCKTVIPVTQNDVDTFVNKFPFERIIVIDSTWNQVRKINNDERLKGIQRVELKSRESLFWRYQRGKPNSYLSTIETVYYFLVDLHSMVVQEPYAGQYDNLLFFFSFMYNKIHSMYDHEALKAYTLRPKNQPKKIRKKFNF